MPSTRGMSVSQHEFEAVMNAIARADYLFSEGEFEHAANGYYEAVRFLPVLVENVEDRFLQAIRCADTVAAAGLAQKMLEICPDNFNLRLLVADAMSNHEELIEKCHLAYTHALDTPSIQVWQRDIAETHFSDFKIHNVQRWHFPMLNDLDRNRAYKQAITLCIDYLRRTNEDTIRVVDIGCGVGLLSIYAATADDFVNVAGIEMNGALIRPAREILQPLSANVFHGHSLDFSVEDLFWQQGGIKADIAVCELFDAGVLGEHVIPTLQHAQEKLLKTNGTALVIPHAAKVFVQPIQSSALRQLFTGRKSVIEGIDEVGEADELPPLWPDSGYTCEFLHEFPHQALADPVSILELNLCDPSPAHFLGCEEDNLDAGVCRVDAGDWKSVPEYRVKVKKSGRVDGLAVWFEADLVPPKVLNAMNVKNPPIVTSCPGRAGSSWQQALFYVPGGRCVRKGEDLSLRCGLLSDGLLFALDQVGKDSIQKDQMINVTDAELIASAWDPKMLQRTVSQAKAPFVARWLTPDPIAEDVKSIPEPLCLSEDEFLEVNRNEWWRLVSKSLTVLRNNSKKCRDFILPSVVLDTSESVLRYPGRLAEALGFQAMAIPPTEEGLDTIPSSWIQHPFTRSCSPEEYGEMIRERGGCIVLADIVSTRGALRRQTLEFLFELSLVKTSCRVPMIFLPGSVTMYVRVIHSPFIERRCHLVKGLQDLEDFIRLDYIDESAVDFFEAEDLNDPVKFSAMSPIVKAQRYDLSSIDFKPFELPVPITTSGHITCVQYWFEATFTGQGSVFTGPDRETCNTDEDAVPPTTSGIFVLPPNTKCVKGQTLNLEIRLAPGVNVMMSSTGLTSDKPRSSGGKKHY